MDRERSPPSCSPTCSPLHSAVNPMEYMQSVFSMCDSDGDGIISVEELKSIGLQIGWDGKGLLCPREKVLGKHYPVHGEQIEPSPIFIPCFSHEL